MKGNPVAILTIGIGVLLLNLAYTGRGADVWRAITGGGAPAGDGDGGGNAIEPTDNNKGVLALQDPVTVRQASDNAEKIVDAPDLKGAGPGGKCHIQSTLVVGPDGQNYCVTNDRLYDPVDGVGGDAGESARLWGLTGPGNTWAAVL